MDRPKVLCYSPYNAWELHGLWEITILHALRLRGADVMHVLCNGVFPACDLHWEATNPRHELSCTHCQAKTSNLSARMGMPFIGLSKYINSKEFKSARDFVKNLSSNNYATARFGDWDIGKWVKSSVHSHFRVDEIDLTNIKVREGYANYVESGLLAAHGLSRLIKEFKPNCMFLFNGRHSSLRVGLELAKKENIDTYLHERGSVFETVQIYKNVPAALELVKAYRKVWSKWQDIPLTFYELEEIKDLLCKMRDGTGQNWKSYTVSNQVGEAEFKNKYGLNKYQKVWTVFTSSLDEEASDERHTTFDSQIDWIENTIKISIKYEHKLFIKIHPNTGGQRSTGVNLAELEEFVKLHNKYIKYNDQIKFIFPDDGLNTYDLVDITDLGITYGSTVGLEMVCMGKQVVVCNEAFYDNLPFIWTSKSKENYEDLLLFATRIENKTEQIRQSLRFAYYYYFRASSIKFPYVKMPDPHNGILNYTTLDDLLPGKEKNLDRICNIILNNEEIIPTPQYSKEEIEKNKNLESKYLL